jgi:hypothetical protein
MNSAPGSTMRRLHTCGVRIPAVLLVAGLALAACGDSPSTPPAATVAAVSVEPATANLIVARTLQLTATPRDANGTPVSGRTIAWHSDNQAAATVTPGGNVSAVAPGTARITATVDGRAGTATITVQLPTVATVTVTPATFTLGLGGSVQLNAALADADGNGITGRTVTWSSSQSAVASVDGNGVVRGVTAGTSVITATADGVTGTAQILVTASAAVVIASISPAQLQEGQSATITGTGFNPDPAQNTVLIDNAPATVFSASPTSLTITVPQGTCMPARNVPVRVTTQGTSDQRTHPLRPAAFLDVQVGQQLRLSAGGTPCLQFDASSSGARYLIGVQSVSTVAAELTEVQVRSVTPAASSSDPLLNAAADVHGDLHSQLHGRGTLPASPRSELMRGHRDAELEFRIQEHRMLERLGVPNRRPLLGAAAAAAGSAAVPGTVAVGDSVTVKYPLRNNSCNASTPVRALVRHKGARSIWLEDVNNPAGGFTAGDYAELADMFDGRIFAANEDYFGEPTDLDGNGRIVIVITAELNKERPFVLGRVFAADLFPGDCPGGNGGEFFYGIAPDSSGSLGFELSVADAREYYPIIIAHELAHVIQFGRRSRTPGATAFQTIWELEGQATLAEEIVGHRITGNQPGRNYGFSVAWNEPRQSPNDWYISPIIDLVYYFGFQNRDVPRINGAPEQCGWLGQGEDGSNLGPCLNRRNIYGVSWSFLRWLSDHFGPSFPGGEQGLHRAMITDTRTGFATMEGLTGRPMAELLAQWSAMLYLDGRVTGLDPKLTMTSWDFYGGIGTPRGPQWTGIWTNLIPETHLQPRQRPFASFVESASVRSGSTAYFLVSGTARPATAISVQSSDGGALPQQMRVWVVRIE